ncbi:ATP-dependent DNA helicase RRM3-like [Eutrema salsugineum]|uniref:ATP-dependent DNA helicase RRM3-like n=1 Tax=Eutrema salsugineum TaxID=72664 RepID=UPI000CED7A06|nr:ATP-dependent DNA helicase RRM3-like [Eutrema salsugineum]
MTMITEEQLGVYNEILNAVQSNRGGVFFVYGFGGTGKTFLWSVLGAALTSKGEVVLNIASSGIASLLLKGGRTAHFRFGIPINVNDSTTCSMKSGTHLADLINETKLIVWDEATLMSKHCFETLDRSMQDIMISEEPFGGKVIVFGGDFCQVLPVIPDACKNITVMAALNASKLWKKCEQRVYLSADSIDPSERVVIPEDDIDTLDTDFPKDIVYTQEFLNSIKISGLPNHRPVLKIGALIILLRNIDPKEGLCNGIRLIVTQLANHVIEARVITGKSNSDEDEKVLIPRMFVTPANVRFPFKMRRRQFPWYRLLLQ